MEEDIEFSKVSSLCDFTILDTSIMIGYLPRGAGAAIIGGVEEITRQIRIHVSEGKNIFLTEGVVQECTNPTFTAYVLNRGTAYQRAQTMSHKNLVNFLREKERILPFTTKENISNYREYLRRFFPLYADQLSDCDIEIIIHARDKAREASTAVLTLDFRIIKTLRRLAKTQPVHYFVRRSVREFEEIGR